MSDVTPSPDGSGAQEPSRRDFIYIAAGGAVAVGGAFVLWPFIDQMNPAADTLALASIRTPISEIAEGEQITVMWRGGPVFIRKRTQSDIESARAVELAVLPDKDARNENEPGAEATDANRSALSAGVAEGVEIDIGQPSGRQRYGGLVLNLARAANDANRGAADKSARGKMSADSFGNMRKTVAVLRRDEGAD